MFLKAHNETDTTTVSIEIRLMITMYVVLKIIIIIIGLYGVKLRFLTRLFCCIAIASTFVQAKATLEKASNQYEMTTTEWIFVQICFCKLNIMTDSSIH